MSLRILKLTNGDNVIGELVGIDKENYKLKNALKLVDHYNGKKEVHYIFLFRWLPYTADEVTLIAKTHVLVPSNPSSDVEQLYDERVAEVFGEKDDYYLSEEDIMLLSDFEEQVEVPDEDETIH